MQITQIEKALSETSSTTFQELCNALFYIKHPELTAFGKVGSQIGTEKTTKGTPDSYISLPNGNFIFAESTTNVSDKRKLEKDIRGCFSSKAKIPKEKIEKIYLFFNFEISQEKVLRLTEIAKEYNQNIQLEFYSIGRISLELSIFGRGLVNQYLGIHIDTGQVLTTDLFVTEYNSSAQSLATRLDNKFFHREREKAELKNLIQNNDLVFIIGPAGAGKTRIALELIREFVQMNPTFKSFCVSYKSCELIKDLQIFVGSKDDSIILVDDPNRIDQLGQIIGFYNSFRKSKLKIVFALRDYAVNQVIKYFRDFKYAKYELQNLSPNEIDEIILSEDLKINEYCCKKIKDIANGNPRLAMMAIRLIKEKRDFSVLTDSSSLFEDYFSSFTKDNDILSAEISLKVLGVISFFRKFSLDDAFAEEQLQVFDISYQEFAEVISKLQSIELVEIKYEHVQIAEQNLATYFFYRTFIKQEILSFSKLLEKNFFRNDLRHRFRDSVISSLNSYNRDFVKQRITPSIQNFWYKLNKSEEKRLFLSHFWFFLEDETLSFINESIQNTDYLSNEELFYELFNLLIEFFRWPDKYLRIALELTLTMIKKSSSEKFLDDSISKFKDLFSFRYGEINTSLNRQSTLLDILLEGLRSNEPKLTRAFFELSKFFLKYEFENYDSSTEREVTISRFIIPNQENFQDFRKKIWQELDKNHSKNSKEVLEVLMSYASPRPGISVEVMRFDVQYVLSIIRSHLDSNNFEHCYYVHQQIDWFISNQIESDEINELRSVFSCPLYQKYLLLDFEKLDGKDAFRNETFNYTEINEFKKQEIQQNFSFTELESFKTFYEDFVKISSFFEKLNYPQKFHTVLNLVIHYSASKNFELGCQMIDFIVQEHNTTFLIPWNFFERHLVSETKILKVWNLISKKDFQLACDWKMYFLYYIPEELLKEQHIQFFIETIEGRSKTLSLRLELVEKLFKIQRQILNQILNWSIEDTEFNLFIDEAVFDLFLKANLDINLIKKAYLGQYKLKRYFDLHKERFQQILKADSKFLLDYTKESYLLNDTSVRDSLGLIWDLPEIEQELAETFDWIAQNDKYYSGMLPHFCNCYFLKMDKKNEDRAKDFLLNYLIHNSKDLLKVNFVVDIARNTQKHLFEQILKQYILINNNPDDFKRIYWRENGASGWADQILADIEKSDWIGILKIVEDANLGVQSLPIIDYLKRVVSSYDKQVEYEKKQKYLRGF